MRDVSRVNFWEASPLLASIYMLIGVYRHNESCKPGMYRVVPTAESQWRMPHLNAVCDDFGNLVVVP